MTAISSCSARLSLLNQEQLDGEQQQQQQQRYDCPRGHHVLIDGGCLATLLGDGRLKSLCFVNARVYVLPIRKSCSAVSLAADLTLAAAINPLAITAVSCDGRDT